MDDQDWFDDFMDYKLSTCSFLNGSIAFYHSVETSGF